MVKEIPELGSRGGRGRGGLLKGDGSRVPGGADGGSGLVIVQEEEEKVIFKGRRRRRRRRDI